MKCLFKSHAIKRAMRSVAELCPKRLQKIFLDSNLIELYLWHFFSKKDAVILQWEMSCNKSSTVPLSNAELKYCAKEESWSSFIILKSEFEKKL